MDLETLLHANLLPTNPAGRPLGEYRVSVAEVAGAIAIRIHPEGFNASEEIFTVSGNVLAEATEATLTGLREQDAAAKVEEARARDLTHQAAEQAKITEAAAIEMKRREEEADAAALSRPADPAKGTTEPAP